MSESNKTVVRRLIEEVWNKRNPAVADELIATNYVSHDPSTPEHGRGPEAYKRTFHLYAAAFPDLRFTIDSIFSEGDLVAARWTSTGTHRGKLNEIEPTGRTVTVTGTTIIRIAAGQVREDWVQWDAVGLMRQLGVLKPMTQAAGRRASE